MFADCIAWLEGIPMAVCTAWRLGYNRALDIRLAARPIQEKSA